MATKWNEVEASPSYQNLSEEDKFGVKQRYLNNVIVPSEAYQGLSGQEQQDLTNRFIGQAPGAAEQMEEMPVEAEYPYQGQEEPSLGDKIVQSGENVITGLGTGIAQGMANMLNIPSDIEQSLTGTSYMPRMHPETYPQAMHELTGTNPYEPIQLMGQFGTGLVAAPEVGGTVLAKSVSPVIKGAFASATSLDPDVDTVLGTIGLDALRKESEDSPMIKRMKNVGDSVALDSLITTVPALNYLRNSETVDTLKDLASLKATKVQEEGLRGAQMFSSEGSPEFRAMSGPEKLALAKEARSAMADPISSISDDVLLNDPNVTIGNLVDLQQAFKNAEKINEAGGKVGTAYIKDTAKIDEDVYKKLGIRESFGEKLGGKMNKMLGTNVTEGLGLRELNLAESREKAFNKLISGFEKEGVSNDLKPAFDKIKNGEFAEADTMLDDLASRANRTKEISFDKIQELRSLSKYGSKAIKDVDASNNATRIVTHLFNLSRLGNIGFNPGVQVPYEAGRYLLSRWNTKTIGDRVKLINAALNGGEITDAMLHGRVGSILFKPQTQAVGKGAILGAAQALNE